MAMKFLDRAKQQAQELKDKVEGKVEDVQAKRKAADLLEELGRLAYAEKTSRPVSSAATESERIIGELRALEEQGVAVLPDQEVKPSDGAAQDDGPAAASN
jgi:hypothetical protein